MGMRIKVPSPQLLLTKDFRQTKDDNTNAEIKEFAKAIKLNQEGKDGVTHENAKIILQQITQILEKTKGSMVDLLPLMFNFNQRPYTLQDHFFFEPIFSTNIATNTIIMSSRQTGKSLSIAASTIGLCQLIPYMRMLVVTPLFEQVRRLSQNYVKPFIEESPIKGLMVNGSCADSILQRDLANRSIMYFSYAFTSVTRCRGISTYAISYDELGELDPSYPAIINQCASSAPDHLKFFRRFGTPKTMDNLMEFYWSTSSKAEWQIRCPHCGHWNIPSLEHDLEFMLGPRVPKWKIERGNAGIICAGRSKVDGKRCGKPLDPRLGMWVHERPELRFTKVGYHIPQCILPTHCEQPQAWRILLGYRDGADNTTPAKFYNEVCGVSYDGSAKLITLTDLKKACWLPTDITKPTEASQFVIKKLQEGVYQDVICAVDWGGGGEDEISFTTIAICALRYDGKIDVPFGYRSLTPLDHEKEVKEIIALKNLFKCSKIVHDGNGSGKERETMLGMCGLPEDSFCRMYYIRLGRGSIAKWKAGDMLTGEKPGYLLDKARSLLWTVSYIKNGYLHFFKYDTVIDGKLGLVDDFLSLVEDKHSSQFASDVYTIIRSSKTTQPDDFTAAVNYGVHYFYSHRLRGAYPKITLVAESNVKELEKELIEMIEGVDSSSSDLNL